MIIVPCPAPIGAIDPAPLTSLPLDTGNVETRVDAFWTADDDYLVRIGNGNGDAWYRIDTESSATVGDDETRRAMAAFMANVTSIGTGRVSFPVGSSGRTVFRVWRVGGSNRVARTTILGVRAARSRRLPA